MVLLKLREFIQKSRRVMLVASKPDPEEFKLSAKITGIGIVIIGVIGFALFLLFTLTPVSVIA
ncbi:MAG: protein translocase SEC61 complex subunit gamma [Candidatus Aenigmarchaeota archaeon]|nr:protein translocase SEC61 complex subunit gamma [Candidatus Aenigmarchaeota archaeon]